MTIDVDTGVYKIRRFYALDDCGTRINPMIIEGQVHGGLTEAFAIAMGQEIRYDDDRQCGDRLVHGFLHADRGRDPALGDRLHRHPVAASPDRRQGRRRKPECRRRAGVLQRRQRRLLVPGVRPTSRCRTTTGATGGRRRIWECSRRECEPSRHSRDAARQLRASCGEGSGCRRQQSELRRSATPTPATLAIAAAMERMPDRAGESSDPTMKTREQIAQALAASGYIADGELATAISLMQLLRRPLLLEGEAGRRQDRGRESAGLRARDRADPAAML